MKAEGDQSFPRCLRLLTATDFQQVFSNNTRRSDSRLTILVGNQQRDKPRLGFAIARKQILKAVKRNFLKRLFRESFRTNQDRLPARDMVIMVRREILLTDGAQLRTIMEQHWNGIIKKCENS